MTTAEINKQLVASPAANAPDAVIRHAQERAHATGHTHHVVRLPDSNALFPFAVVSASEMRFRREEYRPNEVCSVTRYGRVLACS